MRKSTLFISALLTVFLMATMFGVVSAYQQVVKTNTEKAAQLPTQVQVVSQPVEAASFSQPVATATEVTALVITPDEATNIAIDFLGNSDVYSVEVVDYEGAPTYLITFSSGDLVYVSSTGVIIANTKLDPVVVVSSSNNNGNSGQAKDNNNNGNTSSNNSGEHESHEENEGHESHGEHEGHDD